jgi:hypothetical protein
MASHALEGVHDLRQAAAVLLCSAMEPVKPFAFPFSLGEEEWLGRTGRKVVLSGDFSPQKFAVS